MELKKLTDRLSVAGQVRPEDLEALREQGFSVIINNRPDGEMFGQPRSDDLAEKAASLGMTYFHIPISGGNLDPDSVEAFREAMENAETNILAFCRTGTRSTYLWAASEAGHRDVDDIVDRAASAGYDLRGFAPVLKSLAGR